ncbi:MAG TPA: hypothetical protein VGZ33_05590 [Acidimicrobiales bacterium]|nr:hypothetical protein [Acidimicrobiales bacterium]
MPRAPSRQRLLRLHAGLAAAVVICVSAFAFEVLRALGGNTLSWAYVVEWPVLLGYGIYMWQRLVREERTGVVAPARRDRQDPDDAAALEAWNRYLAELHAADAATQDRRTGGPSSTSG